MCIRNVFRQELLCALKAQMTVLVLKCQLTVLCLFSQAAMFFGVLGENDFDAEQWVIKSKD